MPDLLQKVLEALGKKDIPAVCPVDSMQKIPENAQMLGYVPEHLRQLYVLSKEMEKARSAEQHQRCVELLGKEEYDNEQIEFMIYCEVKDDPNFGGDGLIKALFDCSLLLHFPQIPRGKYGVMLYSLGSNWEVYAAIQERRQIDPEPPFGVIIIDKK